MKYYIAIFALTLLLFSCVKKEDDIVGGQLPDPIDDVPNSTFETIDKFFESKKPQMQKFTFDPTVSQNFNTAKGSRIRISPNSLVDKDGNLVTGNVELEFIEIFNPKDMILSKRATTSGGDLLESGGQFYLSAKSGGNELGLKPGATIQISVEQSPDIENPFQMQLFYGNGDEENFDWVPAGDSTNGRLFNNQEKGFELFADRFGWINIDYFYGQNMPKTDVTIIPKGALGGVTVSAFLHFQEINSMMALVYNEQKSAFTSVKDGTIPIGAKVNIVLIGDKDKKFYYGVLDTIIQNADPIEIEMNAISDTDLGLELDKLIQK